MARGEKDTGITHYLIKTANLLKLTTLYVISLYIYYIRHIIHHDYHHVLHNNTEYNRIIT